MISNLLFGGLTALSTGSRFLDLERAEKSRRRSEQEAADQLQKSQSELEWERMRGRLTKNQEQFDPAAQQQVKDFNKRTEALRQSKDRLRPGEYAAELQKLQQTAMEFPWEQHIKPPEQNVIEQNGVQFQKTDKGLEAFAFTPQYVQQNTVQLPNGAMAIPLGPGKGYQVMEKAPESGRNMEFESQAIDAAAGGIDKIYRDLEKKAIKTKEGSELSPEEVNNLWTQAGDLYVTRSLQAKNAAKVVSDGGGANAAIPGRTFNPYKMKDNIARMEKEKKDLQKQVLQNDKLMKTELERRAQSEQWEPFEVSAIPDVAGPGMTEDQIKAEAARIRQQKGEAEIPKRLTAVPADLPWNQQVDMARSFKSATRAYSTDELSTVFGQAPNGAVVTTPDDALWIKRNGRFQAIPQAEPEVPGVTENPYIADPYSLRTTRSELEQRRAAGVIENPYVTATAPGEPAKSERPLSKYIKPRAQQRLAVAPSQMIQSSYERRKAAGDKRIPALAADVQGQAWDDRYSPESIQQIKSLQAEAEDAVKRKDYATSAINQAAIRRIQAQQELNFQPSHIGELRTYEWAKEPQSRSAEEPGTTPERQPPAIEEPTVQAAVPVAQPTAPPTAVPKLDIQTKAATRLRAQFPNIRVTNPLRDWVDDPVLREAVKNAPAVSSVEEVNKIPEGQPFKLPNGQIGIRIGEYFQTFKMPAEKKTILENPLGPRQSMW